MLKPIEIENELKKYVIGQDEYLKELSLIGHRHIKNIQLHNKGLRTINNNTLIIGPSGSGKTYAVEKLSKILDIPFYRIDGSSIQANNYRGKLKANSILEEVYQAHGKTDSERCIIFIDEFDKILDKYAQINGFGYMVQKDFMKILEPNSYKLDREVARNEILDTSCITWLCAGSFHEARTNTKEKDDYNIGFNKKDLTQEKERDLNETDLIKIGYLPELIGRFSNIINLNTLTKENLKQILTLKSSALGSYQDLFSIGDVILEIDESFYDYIVEKTTLEKVGVRGASQAMTKALNEAFYQSCNDETISKIKIYCKDNEVFYDYEYDRVLVPIMNERFDDVSVHPYTRLRLSEFAQYHDNKVLAQFDLDLLKNIFRSRLLYESSLYQWINYHIDDIEAELLDIDDDEEYLLATSAKIDVEDFSDFLSKLKHDLDKEYYENNKISSNRMSFSQERKYPKEDYESIQNIIKALEKRYG